MSHPDDEDLVDVALGPGDDVSLAAEHVRGCSRCADAVAEYRNAAAIIAGVGPGESTWQAPPRSVWDRVQTAVADGDAGTDTGAPGRHAASMHRGAGGAGGAGGAAAGRRSRPGWRRVLPWTAAAAAAGIAVGLLGGRLWWAEEQPAPAPSPVTLMATPLTTIDTRERLGEASVVQSGRSLDLTVDTAPLDPAGGYLEVWLINRDGERMVSVGLLDAADAPTSFPVSRELMDQGYLIVDISREEFDDKPQHSGDSLVRGTLIS